MKKTMTMIYLGLTSLATALPVTAGNTGNFNIFLGNKALDNKDWGVVDKQAEFAVLIDFKESNWPIEIALGVVGSADIVQINGSDVEGVTSETLAGIRKTFTMTRQVYPYAGGGLALVQAEQTTLGTTVDDAALGFWLNAGINFRLTDRLNIGIDYRYSDAQVTLSGKDIEAGGKHFGLFGGFHWE